MRLPSLEYLAKVQSPSSSFFQFEPVVELHALVVAGLDEVLDDLDLYVQVGLGHERAAVVEVDLLFLKRQFSLDDPELGRQEVEVRGAATTGGLLHHNHRVLLAFFSGLGTRRHTVYYKAYCD
jgi:hypothetical protein